MSADKAGVFKKPKNIPKPKQRNADLSEFSRFSHSKSATGRLEDWSLLFPVSVTS